MATVNAARMAARLSYGNIRKRARPTADAAIVFIGKNEFVLAKMEVLG
jgi:hypothetical protein